MYWMNAALKNKIKKPPPYDNKHEYNVYVDKIVNDRCYFRILVHILN